MKFPVNNKLMLTIVLVCLFCVIGYAQPGNPSTPAPLGFIEMLIGAGMMYGGYKHARERK